MAAPNDARVIRISEEPGGAHVPRIGSVFSIQKAEIEVPAAVLAELWKRENLERLARAYWRYLTKISLGLIRVVYEPSARTVVVFGRPLALLRFHAPEYSAASDGGTVTWRIDRGLLVAREGRDQGFLRISVARAVDDATSGAARLEVSAEVRSFYPWLRGSGRFARLGTWLYARTQVRIHAIITKGFLRSLVNLDLPPSRVGALRGEIDAGAEGDD